MPNINLSTQTSVSGDGFSFSNKGLLGSLVIFIASSVLWGGLAIWGKIVDGKIEKSQVLYRQKYEDFVNNNAKEVTDFKNRLDFAEAKNGKSVNVRETLDKIESLLLVSEVWLASYKYDEKTKTILLSCQTKNYSLVAKQILSFKKSDFFSSVLGGKTQLQRSTGIISFDISLSL